MKRWKEDGGKGYIGFSGNVFFIVESYNNGNMETYSTYNIKKDWNNKLICIK
jgi:hypothetical protein